MNNLFSRLFPATGRKKSAAEPKAQPVDNTAPAAQGENPFVVAIAVLIAIVVGASLWVSASALMEKVRLSHGLQQIIDILAAADDAAATHHLDDNSQTDLLAYLERFGRIVTTGETQGMKTLTNPWGGLVVASTMPGNKIRIETILPASKCRRGIDLFDQNGKEIGIEQISVKDGAEIWRDIYTDAQHDKINDTQMTVLCSNLSQADIVLTFSLH